MVSLTNKVALLAYAAALSAAFLAYAATNLAYIAAILAYTAASLTIVAALFIASLTRTAAEVSLALMIALSIKAVSFTLITVALFV